MTSIWELMKTTIFQILTFLIWAIPLNAQETVSRSFLTEPRFNFFKKTILIYNEYLNTNDGSYITTNLRILYPLGNKALNFRFDLPIISTNSPDFTGQTGLGDIDLSIAYIPQMNEKTGIAFRGKINIPTATENAFGTGKWVFISTAFLGHYWDTQKQWFSITSLEQQFSFAGKKTRTPVNTTIFENDIYYSFQKNWVGTTAIIRYNFELQGWQNSIAVEYGRKLTPSFNVYIHPSIAFGSRKYYNNGFEVGFFLIF